MAGDHPLLRPVDDGAGAANGAEGGDTAVDVPIAIQ